MKRSEFVVYYNGYEARIFVGTVWYKRFWYATTNVFTYLFSGTIRY